MADPWLTIIGLGEDGPAGLSEASRRALAGAQVIFGGPRHLALVGAGERGRPWPVPFSIDPVLAEKEQSTVVLASGDPFWFGAGGSLASHLSPEEWVCHPAPSTFALVAARLGWRLEETACRGLHAAPFAQILAELTAGRQIICLMRDGAAVGAMAGWLTEQGFGASGLTVLECLGGPHERVRAEVAESFDIDQIRAPVALAIKVAGARGLPATPGRPDDLFRSDGVMTKAPVRALTLAALAPRAGEMLWDLGAGSGSISVEWCLAAPGAKAEAIESRGDRAENIRTNAARFGLGTRIRITEADWPAALGALPPPDAIFIGGGATLAGIETVFERLAPGARLVVNAVTIETEAALIAARERFGGALLQVALAEAAPLGNRSGWRPARPLIQWSVTA